MGYTVLIIFLSISARSQDTTAFVSKYLQDRYVAAVEKKTTSFNNNVEKYTEKTLGRIIKQENRMRQKMAKINPEKAKKLFTYSIDSLQQFKNLIKRKTGRLGRYLGGSYFPYLDTLKQSLGFLTKAKGALESTGKLQDKLNESLSPVDQAEDKLATVDKINEYLEQRKSVLQSELGEFPALANNFKKMSKGAWYYRAQVSEYKNSFQNEEKLEKLALNTLKTIPAFQQFIQQNGQLAGLFASPASFSGPGGSTVPIVNGLPSRAAVQQYIQNAIPSAGPNAAQLLQQQISGASGALDNLKNRLNGIGGMGNKEMPDFTPNTQHVKSFRKRLEFGTDIHFGQATNFLPANSDIGLQVGYKLNDKSSAGIGIAYKAGLGSGWNHMRFSNESLGLRTYLKAKLKANFYLQGGAEWNYMTQFSNVDQLKNRTAWQTSVLLGLSRMYKISKKVSGNVQLLYDFLYNQHIPFTKPLLFRLGYNF